MAHDRIEQAGGLFAITLGMAVIHHRPNRCSSLGGRGTPRDGDEEVTLSDLHAFNAMS